MIKFRLEKWEKAVVFQILEQDRFSSGEVYSNEEFIISAMSVPELSGGDYIFLRGEDKSCDFAISSVVFDTNTERDEYYNKILKVFSDWKNSLVKSEETKEQNIFEF